MPHCTHCGASATPDQRFCQACGKALMPASGADQAPAPQAPAPQAPAPEQAAAPQADGFPPAAPADYQYIGGTYEEQPPARGRNLGKILGIGAVVVALAGGAFLAYTLLFGKTGAKSPDDAVTQMFEAIAAQDGVEALRMLNPGETEGFGDVYESIQKRVADIGLASGDEGALLEAVKIELRDFEVEVEEKGDNAARVYLVGGKIKITIDEGKLPDELRDLYDSLGSENLEQLEELDIADFVEAIEENEDIRPFLTTIKQDGRWYVSPTATIGEYLVADDGLDELGADDFDKVAEENAPDPKTSKDPEGALSVLAEAISSNDIDQIFAALPQDEVAALRPFGDILQDQLREGEGADLTVSDLETSFEELDDDLGRLTINRGRLSGTIDGDDGELVVDGTCVTTTTEEEVYDDLSGEYSTGPSSEEECLPDVVTEEAGIDAIWVILRKEDGGWQVDPRATLIDYATTAIDSIDEDTLRDALGQ